MTKNVKSNITININDESANKLREESLTKNIPSNDIVNVALIEYFKNEDLRRVKLGKELDSILESCRGFWGGFQIEDSGFVSQMNTFGFKCSDFTADQWTVVKKNLTIGRKGYSKGLNPRNISGEEFEALFNSLDPTDGQRVWFRIGSDEEEELFNKKAVRNRVKEMDISSKDIPAVGDPPSAAKKYPPKKKVSIPKVIPGNDNASISKDNLPKGKIVLDTEELKVTLLED